MTCITYCLLQRRLDTWRTCRSGVKESNLLFQHSLEDDSLHGGVYAAHGDVIHEITYKLKHGTETYNSTQNIAKNAFF